MKLPFPAHPGAQKELYDALAWYEGRRAGLGDDFLLTVVSALESGVSLPPPTSGPLQGLPIRRHLVPRFPYTLIVANDGEPYLIAVAHQSRRPGYWRSRLKTAAPSPRGRRRPLARR